MKPILILWLLLIVSTCPLFAAEPLLERTEVFPPGLNAIARYRIPGVVVTPRGTVLAYCEARKNDSKDWGEIEIHLRRSSDGGRTWLPSQHIAHRAVRIEGNPRKQAGGEKEQTVNNPVATVDRETGTIEFLCCVNYARCFSMRSTDDGATWSKPVEITAAFEPFRKRYDWKVITTSADGATGWSQPCSAFMSELTRSIAQVSTLSGSPHHEPAHHTALDQPHRPAARAAGVAACITTCRITARNRRSSPPVVRSRSN